MKKSLTIAFLFFGIVNLNSLKAAGPVYEFSKYYKGIFGYNYVNKELIGERADNHWMIVCEGRGFIRCKPSLLAGPDLNDGLLISEVHKIAVEERVYTILDEIDNKVLDGKVNGKQSEKLLFENENGKKELVLILSSWKFNKKTEQLDVKVELKHIHGAHVF